MIRAILFLVASFSAYALEEDIHFYTKDGHRINGKVAYPQEITSSTPAIVLVHGSGPADMNHWLPGNLPGIRSVDNSPVSLFTQLRDALLDAGFIVLRYNKRGYGSFPEEIVWENGMPVWANPISITGTYPNLVKDSLQAATFLRRLEKVNEDNIYMLGISEGTSVVMDAAYKDGNIAGLILLSAVARNLRDSLYFQFVTRPENIAKNTIDSNRNGIIEAEELRKMEAEEFPYELNHFDLDQNGSATLLELEAFLLGQFNRLIEDYSTKDPFKNYYQQKFSQNPQYEKTIPHLKGEVLLIQGEIDAQTPLSEALLLSRHFRNNANLNFTFKTYPGLGHGLSPNVGRNKLINTIGPIEQNVLNDLREWATANATLLDQ